MQRSEENLCESVSNMQIAETELRPSGLVAGTFPRMRAEEPCICLYHVKLAFKGGPYRTENSLTLHTVSAFILRVLNNQSLLNVLMHERVSTHACTRACTHCMSTLPKTQIPRGRLFQLLKYFLNTYHCLSGLLFI